MSRSKSVAFSLLLGAVLLGGVLGFTVDRVFRPETSCEEERVDRDTARERFADDVGLNAEQRVLLYSMLDARNAKIDSIYATVRPLTRAVHDSTRVKFRAMLTDEQLANYEAMRQRDRERREGNDGAHDRN